MKLAVSTVLLLVSVAALSGIHSLECYSCDSDLTDLDCTDIKSLRKEVCPVVSDAQLVSTSCGYMRVKGGNNTERISRGCIVAGECNLLNEQSELTSKYRMVTCQECRTELCNGATAGSPGVVLWRSLLMAIAAYVFKRQLM
ncbi:uncharacterized protein LOC135697498 [Ochlerotatus camptorhynchus]|uniref:uncharacterized protein LOC135697498 n=1 Tax=Ochlerotatus camptorhynchus TaxID=644619 RepID=UPI0031D4E80F